MTSCENEVACLHLSNVIQRFSEANGDAARAAADPLLDAVVAEDSEAHDFMVVESYDGKWLDAFRVIDFRAGPILFIKALLPSPVEALAYIHEPGFNRVEFEGGDRVQWLVEREAFTTFARRLAEVLN